MRYKIRPPHHTRENNIMSTFTDIAYFRTAISTGAEFEWKTFWNGKAWEIQAYRDIELSPSKLCTPHNEVREFQTLDAAAGVLKSLGIGNFSVDQHSGLPYEAPSASYGDQCIGT